MSDHNKSESTKRSKQYRDNNKRQRIVGANIILKNCERSQINNQECIVMSSCSNVQNKNVKNYSINVNSNTSDKSDNEFNLNLKVSESNELREWIKDSNVPYTEADKLLEILRKRLIPTLPKTTTFLEMNEPTEVFIKIESEDTAQNPIINQSDSKNGGTQGFMFVDMSQQPFSEAIELDYSNPKPDIGVQILELLKENSQRLNRIEEKQNQLIKYITHKKLADISEISLETMYDLQIPMASLREFDDFEKQLGENELLQTDVCAQLVNCIDRKDCSLSKSFTNMFRTFMSKDLVVQFTAIRKSTKSDKRQFSSTRFYKLMASVLTKSRKERNLPHDIKHLLAALSEVISHATQWNV